MQRMEERIYGPVRNAVRVHSQNISFLKYLEQVTCRLLCKSQPLALPKAIAPTSNFLHTLHTWNADFQGLFVLCMRYVVGAVLSTPSLIRGQSKAKEDSAAPQNMYNVRALGVWMVWTLKLNFILNRFT